MTLVSAILALCGTVILALTAVGLFRFQDTLFRLHVVTKASSLAIVLLMIAVSFRSSGAFDILKMLLATFLCFATVPLGCHILARSARKEAFNAKEDPK